ncbi:MAG: hypothetical protein OEW97_06755, partial [Gammaproteobacteria bacterium]|nr:hypothetical protein [Gammaproteobacteria bacterium]
MAKWISIFILIVLALVGNHFNIDLFYSVAFIFGSISVLIALRLHGILVATLIAVIAGLYTYYLWGHPYAMVIFTIEAAIVGVLLRMGIKSLIIADAIYWLIIGVPLVWLFYSQIMDMANDVALLILLKQPINAIINAITATFLLLILPQSWGKKINKEQTTRIGITELMSSLLISATFISAITILLNESDTFVENLESHIDFELRTSSIIMYPSINELGDITEAAKALARTNTYSVYNEYNYIILQKDYQVVASNIDESKVEDILHTGVNRKLSDSLHQWLPTRGSEPVLAWWKKAYYYVSSDINISGSPARLIVLKKSEELISTIRQQQIRFLSLLLIIIIVGIVFSYIISAWLNRTIIALSSQTKNLSQRLRGKEQINWPKSRVRELSDLSRHAEEMSNEMSTLIGHFVDEQTLLE